MSVAPSRPTLLTAPYVITVDGQRRVLKDGAVKVTSVNLLIPQ